MTSQARRLSILVADDDPDDRVLTRDAIRESGIDAEVRFLGDGVELIAVVRASLADAKPSGPRPDLILLDLRMPRMGGAQALQILMSERGLHRIPIVVLTTSKHQADMTSAYDGGADAYLVKPLTAEAFRSTVRDLAASST